MTGQLFTVYLFHHHSAAATWRNLSSGTKTTTKTVFVASLILLPTHIKKIGLAPFFTLFISCTVTIKVFFSMSCTARHNLANFFACPDALQMFVHDNITMVDCHLQGRTIANPVKSNTV